MTGTANEDGWRKTACILCECSCGIEVQLRDRTMTRVRGDKEHPGSAGYTCEKPLRLDRYQNGRHRLTTPLRRRPDGSYEEIGWDTALDEITARLAAVRDTHGGERIFYYGGGGQANHIGGAMGRDMHRAFGGRYYANAIAQEKSGEAWVDTQLYGQHTAGDFDRCEVAVFFGKNPWQSHGMERARPVLREIARDPGRSIVVIDPKVSETAELADFHLRVAPGTDAWCMSALAAVLVQEDLVAHEWLAEHAIGVEDVLAALREVDVACHARRCGVGEDLIRAAARRIAAARSVATYEDLGIQQSPNSTLVSYLSKLLWVLTGNYAEPGGMSVHSWVVPVWNDWNPVRSRTRPVADGLRRVVGRAVLRHGARPMRRLLAAAARTGPGTSAADRFARLAMRVFFAPVAQAVAVPILRELTYGAANGPAPASGAWVHAGLFPSAALSDEILTDHPDRLRAIVIDSSNPCHSLPGSSRFTEAMRSLEFSVVIDVAFTETAQQADYVLPAASQFEKYEASLFTLHAPNNTFQLRAPLMDALPGTRSEPEIYAALADRLGAADDRLLDELRAAARIGHHAFGLALFATMENRPDLAGKILYLIYRTLGDTMPDGQRTVAVIWGMAHICAIAQPDAVERAGFGPPGFDQGERLFDAFAHRREGVRFTVDGPGDGWDYVRHDDGRIHVAIPLLLDELARIRDVEPCYTSAEFPFVLSAGERRSFTANVIIRNPEWRRRDAEGALRISDTDAGRLGIATGDRVRVVTASGSAEAPAEVTGKMHDGHISLPNGMGVSYPSGHAAGPGEVVGVAPNTLTSDERRDPFLGTPWHKNVPARIEVISRPPTPPPGPASRRSAPRPSSA